MSLENFFYFFLLLIVMSCPVQAVELDAAERAECLNGRRSVCDKLLRSLNSPEEEHQFRFFFEELCKTNKKFKCFKLMVRGDFSEELEQLKKEEPQASFHILKSEAEVTIFRIAEIKASKLSKAPAAHEPSSKGQ